MKERKPPELLKRKSRPSTGDPVRWPHGPAYVAEGGVGESKRVKVEHIYEAQRVSVEQLHKRHLSHILAEKGHADHDGHGRSKRDQPHGVLESVHQDPQVVIENVAESQVLSIDGEHATQNVIVESIHSANLELDRVHEHKHVTLDGVQQSQHVVIEGVHGSSTEHVIIGSVQKMIHDSTHGKANYVIGDANEHSSSRKHRFDKDYVEGGDSERDKTIIKEDLLLYSANIDVISDETAHNFSIENHHVRESNRKLTDDDVDEDGRDDRDQSDRHGSGTHQHQWTHHMEEEEIHVATRVDSITFLEADHPLEAAPVEVVASTADDEANSVVELSSRQATVVELTSSREKQVMELPLTEVATSARTETNIITEGRVKSHPLPHQYHQQNIMLEDNSQLNLEDGAVFSIMHADEASDLSLQHMDMVHHRDRSDCLMEGMECEGVNVYIKEEIEERQSTVAPFTAGRVTLQDNQPEHEDSMEEDVSVERDQLDSDEEDDDQESVTADHHFISIEEDGQIRIEKISDPEHPEVTTFLSDISSQKPVPAPPHPLWYQRLSSTFMDFQKSGWLTDMRLVCSDGVTVAAHQLLLAHASPMLNQIMGDARQKVQDEELVVSIPEFSSAIVQSLLTSLYSGALPQEQTLSLEVLRLASLLGIDLKKGDPANKEDSQQKNSQHSQGKDLPVGGGKFTSIQLPTVVKTAAPPTTRVGPDKVAYVLPIAQQPSAAPTASHMPVSGGLRSTANPIVNHNMQTTGHRPLMLSGHRPLPLNGAQNRTSPVGQVVLLNNALLNIRQTEAKVERHDKEMTVDGNADKPKGNTLLNNLPQQQINSTKSLHSLSHYQIRSRESDGGDSKWQARKLTEAERLRALKLEKIREQQNRACPLCSKPAVKHRYSVGGHRFVYRCCLSSECGQEGIKTAKTFNLHMFSHRVSLSDSKSAKANPLCLLCSLPRINHKNVDLPDGEKMYRGNLYKCCACHASKLSAKKFFFHIENHVSKKHICTVCRKGYSYKHLLMDHIWKEHGDGQNFRHRCEYEGCKYTAKYKQTLHTHVSEHHHGNKRKQRKEKLAKIKCPTCGKLLKSSYYHQFHKHSCFDGEAIFQCHVCKKEGFVNATTLQNHIRAQHSQERPYACQYCDAKYATAISLAGHRVRKHGVNSKGETVAKAVFPCKDCGKTLSTKIKLKKHVEVVHEGKRDYSCRFCFKKFTSKSNMTIHEGSQHTGVLPYTCNFCSKSFTRKSQLSSHMANEHDETSIPK